MKRKSKTKITNQTPESMAILALAYIGNIIDHEIVSSVINGVKALKFLVDNKYVKPYKNDFERRHSADELAFIIDLWSLSSRYNPNNLDKNGIEFGLLRYEISELGKKLFRNYVDKYFNRIVNTKSDGSRVNRKIRIEPMWRVIDNKYWDNIIKSVEKAKWDLDLRRERKRHSITYRGGYL